MHDDATALRTVKASLVREDVTGTAAPGHWALRVINRLLRRRGIGLLHLTLPSGADGLVGNPVGQVRAHFALRSYAAIWKLARRGALGFAEAYMDGDFDTDDLRGLFEFCLVHEKAIMHALPGVNGTRGPDRRFHGGRRNTRDGSRRNIADHYDLGNAFYRSWLGSSMLYSSAVYLDREASLETAQREKLDRVLKALELKPGQTLIEVGCGWGALAEAAARRGVEVDAITISEQQLAESRRRIAECGLEDRVDFRFEDYRDTDGIFDRFVSIEMIEAVGEENWPLFFETMANRLAPGGIGVIQAITIREDAFAQYRQNPDFIQRYIFPGGMLPTVTMMRERATAVGLSFEIVERFGSSYALTLAEWRRRFEAAWPEIAAQGFDERFRRMWLYYLAYCEVGFERGLIDVGLYRMRKPV